MSKGRRRFGIAAITTILFLSSVAAHTDDALDNVIFDELRRTVSKNIGGFRILTVKKLLSENFIGLDDPYRTERIRAQFPVQILNMRSNAKVRLFFVPGCQGIGWDSYGVAGIDENKWGSKFAHLELSTAFANANIRIGISKNEVAELYGLRENGDNAWRNILSINKTLYEMYASGEISTPHVLYDGDLCGDGGIEITFKVDNALSQVQLIPEFFFHVCKRRFGSAWDRNQCKWWTDVEDSLWISGVYVWRGIRSDGTRAWGRKDVEKLAFRTATIP